MTIFLTTQYLEEADELAHRVGIIDSGRIVAEGTPDELKRSVGTDVIVARVTGDAEAARPLLSAVPGVLSVEAHGQELVIATSNGAGVISPAAVALASSNMIVRDLTLRTPTLDDVFLELTGTHIERTNSVLATTGRTRHDRARRDHHANRRQRGHSRPPGRISARPDLDRQPGSARRPA